MRIDLTNTAAGQIAAGSSATNVSANYVSASGSPGAEDRTTLTSDTVSLSSLVSNALSSPEIRQDKVASLTQAINSGQYQLDPGKIAASILDEHA